MPFEEPTTHEHPVSDPKKILATKEEILAAWGQLPEEHQATIAFALLEGLMKSELRPWLQEALALRWPLETTMLATTFPAVQITRDDLVQAHFNEDEIAQLTDDDLVGIGRTMREHFIYDVFWPALEYCTADLLEKKRQQSFREILEKTTAVDGDYFDWMSEIDRYVWMLAGCSVYDLPDFDSRSMFESGLSATEVANEVLSEAGVTLSQ